MTGPTEAKAAPPPTTASDHSPRPPVATAIGVAGLGLVALLDAAVETMWFGSPLRWWLSPVIVALVVGAVWLSRPRGWVASRFGWRGAAGLMTGALFAVLAGSAWLPGGTSNGLRLAGQPSSTVLAAFTALAVVGAVAALAVATAKLPRSLRWSLVGLAGALSVYEFASLALGIRAGTSFTALLGGAGAWTALPYWLQGAWLGVRVVIPAGLLAVLATWLIRREPVRGRALLVMLLVAAVVASAAPAGVPSLTIAPGALPVAVAGLVPTGSGAPAGPVPALPVTPGEMRPILKAFKQVAATVDRTAFDPKARAAALGNDPLAAFVFVRDQIASEPYPGVLRGAAGTLSAGAGNDLDKSLLLGSLLAENGHAVRYAHCTLGEEQAHSRVRGYFGNSAVAPFRDTDLAPVLTRALVQQGLPEGRSAEIVAGRARTREWLDAAVFQTAASDLAIVRDSLSRAGISPRPADPTAALVEEAREHYWVQRRSGDGWEDLDPSVPGNAPGRGICAAAETYDALPPAVFQTITVSVRNEYRSGEKLETEKVLDARLVASDHYGDVLIFRNQSAAASGLLAGPVGHLKPILVAGRKTITGRDFKTTAQSGGTDLFASAFNEEPRVLVAQWLDFTFEAPGRRAAVSRAVVDAVPPRERRDGKITTTPKPEQLLVSLLQAHAIAVTSGRIPAGAAVESVYGALDVEAAGRLSERQGDAKAQERDLAAVAVHLVAAYALEFGAASERALARMSSASGPHLRIVRDQPMVTISAFVVEFRKEEGAAAIGTSIDFRHHAVRVVADGPASLEQAFWANAQHGLVDGALEHLLPQVGKEGSTSTASPGLDTSGAVAAARAAGIEVRAEAGANARALLQGPLAAAGGDRLAAEVLDSTAVVTPVQPVAVANQQRLGLWAIDLTTGHVDALIDNGTRGTIVEYKFIEAEMAFAAFTVRVCVSVFGPGKPICQYFFEQWLELAELALRWAYKVID